jgi:hypothetical protein
MAEILQQSYIDPTNPITLGPDLLETRPTFNDVDDYNGYSESPPKNRDGTSVTGYTGWTRSTKVEWIDPTNPTSASLTDTYLKRITITVTSPTGRVTKLTGMRAKKSAYEDTPTVTQTYSSWIGVTVQVGTDATTSAVSGVAPLNQIP